MPYTKGNDPWKDYPSTDTPITAAKLNNIETGIDNATNTADTALQNVVEDTTPQLGGNLDLNGFVITGMVIGSNVQAWAAVLDATTASFTTALETKLNGIEALADVTDATNVKAALNNMPLAQITPVSTDKFVVQDASDSNNVKYVDYDDLPGLSCISLWWLMLSPPGRVILALRSCSTSTTIWLLLLRPFHRLWILTLWPSRITRLLSRSTSMVTPLLRLPVSEGSLTLWCRVTLLT